MENGCDALADRFGARVLETLDDVDRDFNGPDNVGRNRLQQRGRRILRTCRRSEDRTPSVPSHPIPIAIDGSADFCVVSFCQRFSHDAAQIRLAGIRQEFSQLLGNLERG